MKNYWCEHCNKRWEAENARECPRCHETCDIRETMSEKEAKDRGLIGNNTIPGEW